MMINLQENISTYLSQISDPKLRLSLTEMGFKFNIDLQKEHCLIELSAGFPIMHREPALQMLLHDHLKNQFPSLQFKIKFTQCIRAHRTQLAGKGLRGVKNTLAIAS